MPKDIRTERVLALIFILCGVFLAGDYFIRYHLVLPGFLQLEHQEAVKDLARVKKAIEREINHIEKLGTDWAIWDDCYQFVTDGNDSFIQSNFQWESLSSTGIHLIYVIDTKGKLIYGEAIDPLTKKPLTLSQIPQKSFPLDHFLLRYPDNTKSFAGILLTDGDPLLLSSHQILTSQGKGPSRGTLLLGRFCNAETLDTLRQQTQIEFAIRTPLQKILSEPELLQVQALQNKSEKIEIVDDNTLQVFGLLNDLQSNPAMLITATLPRTIMERGRDTARFSSLVLLLTVGLIIFSGVALALFFVLKSRQRQEAVEALVELRTDQLRMSEERFHALSDASFEAIFITEHDLCLEQNQTAEKMFGYSHAEALGSDALMWFAPDNRQFVLRKYQERDEKPFEARALSKDGRTFPVLIQSREAEYRGRKVIVSAISDLTEQKRSEQERQLMEERLLRSQKMESLGLMAGGVAHDLNNILSGVITYPELMLMHLSAEDPFFKPIKAIRESGKRAAEVVDDLLTLARGVSSTRENTNLNTIVAEYTDSPEFHNLELLHPLVKYAVDLEPQLFNIHCSFIHIKKCVMNLVTNGAEAIVKEGEIRVSTRNQYCEAALPGYPEMQQGEYAVLIVSDTGQGIPNDCLERIFEPFFSRKVVGRSGTGLGLAVIWNTVQDHRGGIVVNSDRGGTTFELYFPATREELASVPETVDIATVRGNQESILVVDDDQGQRAIALQILALLNYQGTAVNSGEEALTYLSNHTVDLVILDMIMAPGINGCETYKRILAVYPKQKAIITSGFAESVDVQETLALGARRFVKKPYLIGTIAVALHDTLKNL